MFEVKEGGDLRQPAEKRKMRQANTNSSRKRAAQINNHSLSDMAISATSGLASSMVFTPIQGLELVFPDANKNPVCEAILKWFSDNSGFQSALPKNK